jgi:hypothetical protein
LDVRELLRAQTATEWVIISTGMFMSYLFDPEFGVVDLERSEVHALGTLDTAVTLTIPDDIGALTAEIVLAEPTIRNEIVYLAGDTVTYGEVADKLEVALHSPFSRSEWTVPFLLEELARDPLNMMRKCARSDNTGSRPNGLSDLGQNPEAHTRKASHRVAARSFVAARSCQGACWGDRSSTYLGWTGAGARDPERD